MYIGRKARRFFAMICITVLLLPFMGILMKLFMSSEVFQDLWIDMIEAIPFGSEIVQFTVKVLTGIVPKYIDAAQYTNGVQQINGFTEGLQEFAKLCLTAVMFSFVKKLGNIVMGIGDKPKGFDFLSKGLWNMVSIVLCSVIVGGLINFTWGQINQLGNILTNIITGVITLIILAGAVLLFMPLLNVTLGMALGYVFVNVVLVNAVQMLISSMAFIAVVIGTAEGIWPLVLAGLSGWLGILMILFGIELMMDSVFK